MSPDEDLQGLEYARLWREELGAYVPQWRDGARRRPDDMPLDVGLADPGPTRARGVARE